MKVLVVGGGIGGLVTGLSLRELGHEVDVFEAVEQLRPLGVGLNLLPHAVRELSELGLQPALEQAGVKTRELVYYSKHGQRIWREARGLEAGYRWPQISIHRGRLQMLLLEVALERLGRAHVHTDRRCVSFEQTESSVRARFVSQDGQHSAVEGDLLVGADGIHSRVRALLYPDEGLPCWNGAILWRGVTRGQPFLTGASMIMAGHATHKFVCYPLGKDESGHELINWVAELHFPRGKLAEREDWNKAGELEDFLPRFEDWRFDWLDVPGLIRGAGKVYVYPMVDRDPLARWSFGRVTLLGDAAHPMYPIGSNGASQAILDARALAGCLRSHTDSERALRAYEAARLPGTAAIVLSNRKQGPEECMTLVEARAPQGFAQIEDVISHEELREIADKYKKVAGFSIDELNKRPSLAHLDY